MGTHPIFESDFDCLTECHRKEKRREEARAKYGDQLRATFKKVDKDNSGSATIDEMCEFLVKDGQLKLGSKSQKEFNTAIKHYLDTMNYDKRKEGELNEEEFVKFWADFYALFDKIDKDGDGEIEIVECVELLDDKAAKFGLTKGDLFKRVVHFYNLADTDGNRKISLVEFFIQLPKLEEFLLNKKLGK